MAQSDLSKYARHPWVPYIDADGSTRYYPALSWCRMEPDGTIVARVEDQPEVAVVYPPFMECDERKCYRRWLQYNFLLYPSYEIEEVGEDYVVARRADGVKFKVIGRLASKVLLELAKYPNGIELFDVLPILIGWAAALDPESYKEPSDSKIAEDAEAIVVGLGMMYYELGLIDVKRIR